jgi:hypothetical protein
MSHIEELQSRFVAAADAANDAERERLKTALFAAGPQWADRSPDDIIAAIEAAGFLIVSCRVLDAIQDGLNRVR